MRSLRFFSSFAMVLAALAFGISFAQAQSEDDDSLNIAAPSAEASASDEPTSGREPLPLESDRYGKTWAIVVGCDYKNRGDAAPFLKPLETAENDAREFAQTLVDIYGYQAAPTPEKEQTLFLLLGADATEAAINDALVHLKTAKENDSVLFYFAGHGVRFSGSALHDRGAIFPSDVVFSADGQPVQHRLRLHSDLLAAVHESKARHRLIILDSCHSGEIFNASAQPRRDADLDTSAETVGRRCLQVIASCGDLEVASDGSGSHSPFTRALIDALKSPPRAEWVTTNELFYFMRPRLKPLRQTPDCRNFQLHGDRDSNDSDGEFRFYVACSEAELSRHRGQAHDPVLLQATVAGEHGRWWFETMPWFIPAFRAEILRERDAVRGDARWVTRDELRNMATRLLDKRRAHLNDPRRRHFELLWEMDRRGQDLRNTLTLIRDDLTKLVEEPARAAQPRSEGTSGVALSEAEPTPRRDYTAENLHFLAVVKHQLRDRDAE
ncbi:MAG TPA: caspase family protein, partial [Pirellulales bacterium]